jgi:hypothetical protein
MNKTTILLLMTLTLVLTACGGTPSNTSERPSGTQGGPSAGALSAPMQVAIGTIKLDGTDNAVTAAQAKDLLPLWETLQVLYSSDTAATEEVDALEQQIQDTMTAQQTQAITALNLSRQDMFSIMQAQGGAAFGGGQNGIPPSGGSSGNGGRNFGGGGGEFQGPPPDGGGFPGGGPGFQGQGSARTQNPDSSTTSARPAIDPNRIPTPLVQAVIEYLKKKAGA